MENDGLGDYRVIDIDITKSTLDAVKELGLSQKEAVRCKNMWTLGLVYWLYGRDRQPTIDFLNDKFKNRPEISGSNIAALNAGHAFGETMEVSGETSAYKVSAAEIAPGLYRTVTGIDALSWGLVTAAQKAGLRMTFAGYPITPASAILHTLSKLKQFDVVTFQAEDEIAAVCAAVGGSYAGTLGVTASSGPGVALKTEAIGLAISVELPLVVINVQRAGPSTGLPTKTEQSDLYQAVYGRNADSPLPVVAARSPADCFDAVIEATRIATKYMTPVMLLADGYMANASEPWLIPDVNDIGEMKVAFHTDPTDFHPFTRNDETLARAWAIPGTPGTEHRIGGIEKSYSTGNISYEPENHQKMTDVEKRRSTISPTIFRSRRLSWVNDSGDLAVLGWGSTYGPINRAVQRVRADGLKVSHIHLRHIWPLPKNLVALLNNFNKVLIPEMNTGQLITVIRSEYLIPALGLNKVSGQPFKVSEVDAAIRGHLE